MLILKRIIIINNNNNNNTTHQDTKNRFLLSGANSLANNRASSATLNTNLASSINNGNIGNNGNTGNFDKDRNINNINKNGNSINKNENKKNEINSNLINDTSSPSIDPSMTEGDINDDNGNNYDNSNSNNSNNTKQRKHSPDLLDATYHTLNPDSATLSYTDASFNNFNNSMELNSEQRIRISASKNVYLKEQLQCLILQVKLVKYM